MSNDAPVHIVPYDHDWPSRFEAERQLLIDAIGAWLVAGSIEHIGSTAIPGLDASRHRHPGWRSLHRCPLGSPLWIEQLTFRDYLRTHPDVAMEYAALKHRLAEAHRFDREGYTNAKAPFVQRLLQNALRSR